VIWCYFNNSCDEGPANGGARYAVRPLKREIFRPIGAGAARPVDLWLDQLAEGGRLIIPLTIDERHMAEFDVRDPGAVFRIERRGEDYGPRGLTESSGASHR
jgi:hypothetical protein